MPSPIITDDEGDALCCDSILLLIGLAPAILYITFTDKAYLAGAVLNTVFRFAVLPHARDFVPKLRLNPSAMPVH